jgi:hypothetical protein
MIARMSYQQPPSGWGQQWNQQPSPGPYPPMYPPPRQTNTMAIVALVGSLVLSPLGIIFGHIALSQIKRTGEDGRGLALAGLIIGYVSTGIALLVIVIAIVIAAVAASTEMDRSPNTTTRHGTYSMPAPSWSDQDFTAGRLLPLVAA